MEPTPDKILRDKIQERDQDLQQQLRNQMSKQEESLKGYFKQFKKPVDQDPKRIKRDQSAAVDRTMVFKQALRPFQLFHTFYQFWNMECSTPQQSHTLNLCKKNMVKNMAKGISVSLILTSIISFKYRSQFTMGMHFLGFSTALMSGFLYGTITSTKFTLEHFERLGKGFELGRNASYQIEKYRMDLNTIKK